MHLRSFSNPVLTTKKHVTVCSTLTAQRDNTRNVKLRLPKKKSKPKMFENQNKNIYVCTSLAGASSPVYCSVNQVNTECHQYVQHVRTTVLMHSLSRE